MKFEENAVTPAKDEVEHPFFHVMITAPFHKIILNGRGHVFCVCFDFSRPFFSLRLQNQVRIINHQVKRGL